MADKLVICACKWRNLIPKQKIEEQVVKAKLEGCEVEVVDDLCALLLFSARFCHQKVIPL